MDQSSPATPLFRQRAFLRFLYVRIAASIALQMQTVAVGWLMYALTGSSLDLGLVGLVQFVPAAGLFLITGQAADRYDRRVVSAIAQGVEALAAAILAVATATGSLTPGLILAMAFFVGAGRAFEQPSLQSILPNIVSAQVLPRAIAAANSAAQTAVVAGPALGGVLIALSPSSVFAACALLWLSASVVTTGIAMERVIARREKLELRTLFSGLAYIGRNKVVLGAIVVDLFAVLFGGATALLPIFARDIFHAGPLGFGALRAAPAAGALVAALVLTRRPITRRVGHTLFAAVAAFGLATIALAASPVFPLAMAALVIVGASDTVSVVIRQTLVQLHTPDHMRGRVFAVNSMFTSTSNQLGTFRAGTVAALVGTIPAVLIGGASTLIVVVASAALFRQLYRAEGYEPAES
jgi:MFS family permease